jgi:arylsulfatase A-like enzyme
MNPRGRFRPISTQLAISVAAVLASCSDQRDPRPNIVWVSVDTLRADHLTSYGYGRDTAPQIDRLAKQGAVFERCNSTATWTLPAHVSMLTGLPTSAHGMCSHVSRDVEHRDELPLRGTFVSELLRDSGYATAGFYTWKYLDPQFGLGAGFDVWERVDHNFNSVPGIREQWSAAKERGDDRTLKKLHDKYPHLFDSTRPWSGPAVDRAVGWLDEHARDRSEQPFLLFLHLFDVHDPYTPPAPYDRRFDPDDALGVGPILEKEDFQPAPDAFTRRNLAKQIALYDGEIAGVDDELSRLFARLDELELSANTLVIVTADHGEEFAEHGNYNHGKALYRETLQVPLILRLPGRIPAGVRVQAPVSVIDLAPTVLALAKLGPAQTLGGIDLVAEARGERASSGRRLFAELSLYDSGPKDAAGNATGAWMVAMVDEKEKIIVRMPGTPRANAVRIDLAQDPLERGFGDPIDWSTPLGARVAADLERWRSDLWSMRRSARLRRMASVELDEATQAELRALGYTSGAHPILAASGESEHLCMDGCTWRGPSATEVSK